MENFRILKDRALLTRMEELAADERRAVAESVACLAEVERRKAYNDLGYPDIFAYAVKHLRYSTGAAYRRIYASRAAERRKEIYADLKSGELSLCVVALIAPDLDGPNGNEILSAARGKSKRQMEEWLGARKPAASPEPDRIRVRPPAPAPPPNPIPSPSEFDLPAPPPPTPTYQYAFVASAALHQSIERLRDVLWNKMPFGRLDDFLQEAVRDYLERHDPELKLEMNPARASEPRPTHARRVPNGVRNQVWARDGGRCAYVSPGAVRCPCRRGLELDHVLPYSLGGRSDDPANIRLLCREHNQLARRQALGEGKSQSYPQFSTGGK